MGNSKWGSSKKKKKNKYTEDKKGLFGSIFLIWVSNIIFLL